MGKRFVPILAIGVMLAVAACGGGSKSSAEGKKPDPAAKMVFLDSAPNPDLDPASTISDSSFSQAVLYAIYDRLLTFEPNGALKEGLAKEWGFTGGGLTTFRVTLRDGITFHDGKTLDAQAVKANLERSKSLGKAAGPTVAAAAAEIQSVTAVDAKTVNIALSKPDGSFPFALASQLGMMVSPASLTGAAGVDLKPVGAGPYKVKSFQPNNETVLERFDAFWDGSKTRPATFTIKYVTDDQTRLNALRSGQANVALLSPRQLAEAKQGGLETTVNNTSSMWVIYENTSRALKDVKVRQALMHAIDRKSISKALSFGTGQPSAQLLPPGSTGHVDDADAQYPYDPEKAKQLLSEAGQAGGLALDFVLLNTPEYSQIAEVLQQQFAKVGVTLRITTLDISQAGQFISGKTGDLMLARWGGRADPLKTLQVVIGPGGTYAPAGPVTPKLAELLGAASRYAADDPARAGAIKAANQEAVAQAANIPVMTRANIYAFRPGCIKGLGEYLASGSNDWRDVTVATGCSGR